MKIRKAVNYAFTELLNQAMFLQVPLSLLVLSACGVVASFFLGWRYAIPSAALAIAGTGLILANLAVAVNACGAWAARIHAELVRLYEQEQRIGTRVAPPRAPQSCKPS